MLKDEVAKAKKAAAAASAEAKHLTAQLKAEAAKLKVERLENRLAKTQEDITAGETRIKELKAAEIAQQEALGHADEALEAANAKVQETREVLAAIVRE